MKVVLHTHNWGYWGYWGLIIEPAMLQEIPHQRMRSAMRQTTLCAQIPVTNRHQEFQDNSVKEFLKKAKALCVENQGTGIINHQDINFIKY